jgi:hypothetical protein
MPLIVFYVGAVVGAQPIGIQALFAAISPKKQQQRDRQAPSTRTIETQWKSNSSFDNITLSGVCFVQSPINY